MTAPPRTSRHLVTLLCGLCCLGLSNSYQLRQSIDGRGLPSNWQEQLDDYRAQSTDGSITAIERGADQDDPLRDFDKASFSAECTKSKNVIGCADTSEMVAAVKDLRVRSPGLYHTLLTFSSNTVGYFTMNKLGPPRGGMTFTALWNAMCSAEAGCEITTASIKLGTAASFLKDFNMYMPELFTIADVDKSGGLSKFELSDFISMSIALPDDTKARRPDFGKAGGECWCGTWYGRMDIPSFCEGAFAAVPKEATEAAIADPSQLETWRDDEFAADCAIKGDQKHCDDTAIIIHKLKSLLLEKPSFHQQLVEYSSSVSQFFAPKWEPFATSAPGRMTFSQLWDGFQKGGDGEFTRDQAKTDTNTGGSAWFFRNLAPSIDDVFAVADLDNSGGLSKSELSNFLHASMEVPGKRQPGFTKELVFCWCGAWRPGGSVPNFCGL